MTGTPILDRQPPSAPRGALAIIATVAVIAALYLGRAFFIPLCMALVLTALLSPLVEWLARRGLPAPAGAAISVLAFLALLIGAGASLEAPLRNLAKDVPKSIAAAQARIAELRAPLARIGIRIRTPRTQPVTKAGVRPPAESAGRKGTASAGGARADSASQAVATDSSGTEAAPAAAQKSATAAGTGSVPTPMSDEASSRVIGAARRTFLITARVLSELVAVLLLTAFLLAGGKRWSEKLGRAAGNVESRDRMLGTVLEIRAAVARYTMMTALISLGQAAAVGLAVWALGIKSPLLWAGMALILEFIPYLGGFVMIVLLLIAGLASGGTFLHAVLGPLAYLAITTVQNNLVSPTVYGRGLRLNPAAILLTVMFWFAMWGFAGAFLAVPILAAFRILTTKVHALKPASPFLEE